MIVDEGWLPIPGYEGAYEVSNLGNVRSLSRVEVYERVDQYSGRVLTVKRSHKGKALRPGRSRCGHVSVSLGRNNSILVHVLVLETFAGKRPEGMECLHRDGRPDNNRLENLRWGTRSENLHDAVRHGAKPVGEDAYQAKLRNSDIPVIRSLFGRISYCEIGRRYGVSDAAIRQIKDGKSWKHIGGASV